jgi:hypothetical protein
MYFEKNGQWSQKIQPFPGYICGATARLVREVWRNEAQMELKLLFNVRPKYALALP